MAWNAPVWQIPYAMGPAETVGIIMIIMVVMTLLDSVENCMVMRGDGGGGGGGTWLKLKHVENVL